MVLPRTRARLMLSIKMVTPGSTWNWLYRRTKENQPTDIQQHRQAAKDGGRRRQEAEKARMAQQSESLQRRCAGTGAGHFWPINLQIIVLDLFGELHLVLITVASSRLDRNS